MWTIALEGIEFYAFHGFYESERRIGGQYVVDVYVNTELAIAESDLLQNTLDYQEIYAICAERMQVPVKLIETLAYGIAADIEAKFPWARGCRVRIAKCAPPLPGKIKQAVVEFEKIFAINKK